MSVWRYQSSKILQIFDSWSSIEIFRFSRSVNESTYLCCLPLDMRSHVEVFCLIVIVCTRGIPSSPIKTILYFTWSHSMTIETHSLVRLSSDIFEWKYKILTISASSRALRYNFYVNKHVEMKSETFKSKERELMCRKILYSLEKHE